jgi:hypothetical protein
VETGNNIVHFLQDSELARQLVTSSLLFDVVIMLHPEFAISFALKTVTEMSHL